MQAKFKLNNMSKQKMSDWMERLVERYSIPSEDEKPTKILKEMPNSTKKERLDEEDKLIEKWNKGQLLNKQKKPPLLFGIVN